MHIDVIIATTGRPAIVSQVVARLFRQDRLPDGVVIVGASDEDIEGIAVCHANRHETLDVIVADRGLCKQRNAGLEFVAGRADAVVFFDDDFVPADDFLTNLEALFAERAEVVGATGVLIADGAQSTPLGFDEAALLVDDAPQTKVEVETTCQSLYGCNMAIRMSAAQGLRFDEKLPLYGWQEDVDYTHQLSWRGTLLRTGKLTGVHMGARSGKTSGKRLGYSQVANIVYLWRKGTIAPGHGENLMFRNIAANIARSFWSESDIDRRGRLKGNLLAFADLVRGRIDPERIEAL